MFTPTICKALGGGLQQVVKTVPHTYTANNVVVRGITSVRRMVGWAGYTKIAVIGRSMKDRVKPFAEQLEHEYPNAVVETWAGWIDGADPAINLANNKAWIKHLQEEGYTIFYTGLDPAWPPATGPFYGMEIFRN